MLRTSALCTLFAVCPLAAQTDPNILARLLQTYKPDPAAFSFAAIGDQQYGPAGEAKWPALAKSINDSAASLKFVVHAGDIKSGSTLCTDEVFSNRLESFNSIQIPLIITPGDNEWTDCHRANNGAYDPLDRLALERRTFFSTDESLGAKKIKVFRESEDARYTLYRENAIWTEGNVVFATLHIIGSNNNLGRTAISPTWIGCIPHSAWRATAALARSCSRSQADPPFPRGIDGAVLKPDTGFEDFIAVLESEAIVFDRPILVIHGDTHTFRVDKPMVTKKDSTVIENIQRLEVPGSSDSHWVRVSIDPTRPNSFFSFAHVDVPENRVKH
jgi:hypothetical protein